jgi:hypothetical protein
MAESDAGRRRRAVDAVRRLELDQTEALRAIRLLSSKTTVEALEFFEDEIRMTDTTFAGPVLWHVQLVFQNAEDDITLSESFPGTFQGRFDGDEAVVERLTADTRSFTGLTS